MSGDAIPFKLVLSCPSILKGRKRSRSGRDQEVRL